VASELDRALDVAVDGEILLADDFAFDADGLADPRDDPAFGAADFVGDVTTPLDTVRLKPDTTYRCAVL